MTSTLISTILLIVTCVLVNPISAAPRQRKSSGIHRSHQMSESNSHHQHNHDNDVFYKKHASCSENGHQANHIKPASVQLPSEDELACPINETYWATDEASEAVCPWVYYLDYDPDRVPSAIHMVKCKRCNWCLDSDGQEIKDSMMECTEVSYRMRVLKKQDGCAKNGMAKYRNEMLVVTVACSCRRMESRSYI